MYTVFEWDEAKAEINHRKHNVRFEEAATVFHDPFIANMPDPDHSTVMERRMYEEDSE